MTATTKTTGFLPGLCRVITFVGGPWDGAQIDGAETQWPEHVTTKRNDKKYKAPEYAYKLTVVTRCNVTKVFYTYCGINSNDNE